MKKRSIFIIGIVIYFLSLLFWAFGIKLLLLQEGFTVPQIAYVQFFGFVQNNIWFVIVLLIKPNKSTP